MAHEELPPDVRRCVDECSACHELCTECVPHCLSLGGAHAAPDHIRELLDCARLCAVSVELMLRQSDFQVDVCDICAEACDLCAESCDPLAGDDDMMQRCADQCRRCADACRAMTASMTEAG